MKWYENHTKKRENIVERLKRGDKSFEDIWRYFDYENMKIMEPKFCPLYQKNTKCHDTERINCLFCACPFFYFDDEGIVDIEQKTLYSLCKIEKGERFISKNALHQDCTNCTIPHVEGFLNLDSLD